MATPLPWREGGWFSESASLHSHPIRGGRGSRGERVSEAGVWLRGTDASGRPCSLRVAPKGLTALEPTGRPSVSLLPPPPPVPFLWTSHPVFGFRPTYLSNLRGESAGAAQARLLPGPAGPSGLAVPRPGCPPPGEHAGHCPPGVLLFLTHTPSPAGRSRCGCCWGPRHPAEPSPLRGPVCSE